MCYKCQENSIFLSHLFVCICIPTELFTTINAAIAGEKCEKQRARSKLSFKSVPVAYAIPGAFQ